MIDSLAILLSTLLCVYVIYRAVELDKLLPWFEGPVEHDAEPDRNPIHGWRPPWESDKDLPRTPEA